MWQALPKYLWSEWMNPFQTSSLEVPYQKRLELLEIKALTEWSWSGLWSGREK